MVGEEGQRHDEHQQGPELDPKFIGDLSKEQLQSIYSEQDARKQFE